MQNCAGAGGLALFETRTSATAYGSYGITVAGVAVTVPLGQFSTGSTNALTQSETRAVDPRFGAVTSLIGPNTLTTTWQYDDFGRRVQESRADGTQTRVAYCLISGRVADLGSNSAGCAGHGFAANEVPALAVRYEHSINTNAGGSAIGPYTRSYYDRAGRLIRVVTQAFDGANQPGGANRLLVQDTDYDAFGQVAVATLPYFLDSGSSTPGGSGDAGMTTTSYDALGRVVAVYTTDPQGQAGSVAFGSRGMRQASRSLVAYAGLVTTSNNDQGQTRQEEANLEGKAVRITDALGNRIEAVFDIRGRKTQLNDPDAGITAYCYDALGQLKVQQFAPGQRPRPRRPRPAAPAGGRCCASSVFPEQDLFALAGRHS
ncbi:MAG: RHS repeat protein [Rubrivivax sp.]